MNEMRKMSGPRPEDEVAGWLSAVLTSHLVSHGSVHMKGREYSIEVADEKDPTSVLVLTRVTDSRRFEVEIEVDAIELPAATSGLPDSSRER